MEFSEEDRAYVSNFHKYFQQWEDVISRYIFGQDGIKDEEVAASFHKLVELDKDEEVGDFRSPAFFITLQT
jgi:hypothetical protein